MSAVWKNLKTLPEAQWTQGIEYFDSFNTFTSKQKLQRTFKYLSNFCFAKMEIYVEQLWKNHVSNLKKIHVSILTNQSINFEKSI